MSDSREYSRRERKRRGVNVSAIEKLKQARSGQSKSIDNVKDEEALYDYVTEDQYADIVNTRLQDDWVVGDIKGSGYDDTGREIFDNEQEEWTESTSSSGKRKKPRNVKAPSGGGITKFLMKGNQKAKAETKTLGTDALLDELLTTLDSPVVNEVKESQRKPSALYSSSASKKPEQRSSVNPLKPVPTRILQKSKVSAVAKQEAPVFIKEPDVPFKDEEEDAFDDIDIDMGTIVEDIGTTVEEKVKVEQPVPKQDVKQEVKMEVVGELKDNSSWNNPPVFENQAQIDTTFDKGSCPMVEVNGQEVFKMFYFDMYENSHNNPGTVYLFGKVQVNEEKFTSGCVVIKNIPRTVFLLPRDTHVDTGEEVKMLDVYQEFNDVIAPRFKINKFQSKPSSKKFAWSSPGVDVPYECEYLEVRYPSESGTLPFNLEGKTFSRVFGTNQTALENLILSSKLKGPSWVYAKNVITPRQQITWSTYEVVVEKASDLVVVKEELPPPPLCCVSLSIKTLANPKTNVNEIVSVGALVQPKFHIDRASPSPHYTHHLAAVSISNNNVYPYDFEKVLKQTKTDIECFKSERSMLGWFIARLQKIDPDIIIGFDTVFDVDVLLHRLIAVRVPHWSRVSRFKRTVLPKGFGAAGIVGAGVLAGRIVADTKILCRELVRLRKYDLNEFAKTILHTDRQECLLSDMYDTSQKTVAVIHHTLRDAELNIRIAFELMALPLSHQITRLCGNVWQRTLLGGRAERNEYLLLHAFHEQEFIVPDKMTAKMKATSENEGDKKKDTYSGGLVLEPKKGFYDTYILLLDFNSLYPSIIQEYNICFTTVDTSTINMEGIANVPSSDLEPGILPIEIRKLVERRKDVKNLLKKEAPGTDKYLQYDIRQKALKLTANSMYGCLGFSNSRFYAKALAALVTSKGREALLSAKDLVEGSLRLEVIYGDTDSIMINTHSTEIAEVMKLGRMVKLEVNKMYRLLEIDIDGVFKSMLLLKKKKYAAITLQVQSDGTFREEKELKGLDIVRRDWSDLAKDAGSYVLDCILSDEKRDTVLEKIHSYLTDIGKKVTEGTVLPQKFVINKSLTKNPSEYPDKKSQAHVQVALRLISQGRRVVAGDVIEYVICEDGTTAAPTQRAYHPSEIRAKPDSLKVDTHYYLSSQLHPVVSRLCYPIEGTDAALIAECLGLDPTSYKRLQQNEHAAEGASSLILKDQDRYKDCLPFILACQECSSTLTITAMVDTSTSPHKPAYSCGSCGRQQGACYIANKLLLAGQGTVHEYYRGQVRCDDTACSYTSTSTPLNRKCPICFKGTVSYVVSEMDVFNQLSYYLTMVDYKNFNESYSKLTGSINIQYLSEILDVPYKTIKKLLDSNKYSQIDLTQLFAMVGA